MVLARISKIRTILVRSQLEALKRRNMKIIEVHGCLGDCPFISIKKKDVYICLLTKLEIAKEYLNNYDYIPLTCPLEDKK